MVGVGSALMIGASPLRDRCVLKGAALLTLWMDDPYRASRDIDLLAGLDLDQTFGGRAIGVSWVGAVLGRLHGDFFAAAIDPPLGEYAKRLHEDIAIREAIMKALKQAAVSRIVIERPHKKCRVTIYSARPGVVIGKKGADIDKIRKLVGKLTGS